MLQIIKTEKRMKIFKSYLASSIILAATETLACTNFLITPAASADGSALISYAADSHTLFGELYYYPAADHAEGEMLNVYEWDTNRYLGQIPQVKHTYSVIGNTNEWGLTIAETTFGGREELVDSTGIIDYGSLIYITLQRARTASEAIDIMTNLVEQYGYCSEGESFSIGDANEVWIMEMIGKGAGNRGAVWVAQRIPDGYVSGHANQARITKINFKDKANVRYAPDVVKVARKYGFYAGKKDADFDFAEAYNPLDFGGVRFCDARVWSGFRLMNKEMMKYEKYAMGLAGKEQRMPLYIKPDHLISRNELANIMRDHYEGTQMDMTQDIGAGPYHVPYRWRPMEFKVNNQEYLHERAIATQQTGFWFVSQMRQKKLSILWFGVDDANTSVLMPIYCKTTIVPAELGHEKANMLKFSWNSAFWIFNWVAQMAYARYDQMIGDIRKVQSNLNEQFEYLVSENDKKIDINSNNADIQKQCNNFAQNVASQTVEKWRSLGEFLLVKFLDGNIHLTDENNNFKTTDTGYPASPQFPGYNDEYYKIISEKTGEHLKMRDL